MACRKGNLNYKILVAVILGIFIALVFASIAVDQLHTLIFEGAEWGMSG